MAHGKLNSCAIDTLEPIIAYVAPQTCLFAKVNVHLNNGTDDPVDYLIAITTAEDIATVEDIPVADIIEADVRLSGYGILDISQTLSPGEKIIVIASAIGGSIRVSGNELTEI